MKTVSEKRAIKYLVCEHDILQTACGNPPNLQLRCIWGQSWIDYI